MLYRRGVPNYTLSLKSVTIFHIVLDHGFLLTRCRRARVIATSETSEPEFPMAERSLHTIEPAFVFQKPHFALRVIVMRRRRDNGHLQIPCRYFSQDL